MYTNEDRLLQTIDEIENTSGLYTSPIMMSDGRDYEPLLTSTPSSVVSVPDVNYTEPEYQGHMVPWNKRRYYEPMSLQNET